jgi:processive 1,2-diacylglycerol beta-glucosyltransferase
MLEGLFRVKHELQIVPICRRNTALYESLQALHVPPGKRLRVIGFTREMDELMTAADLIVGKPGGLTTSEALAKGLAFVVVNPIPGQEERNSDYLLEEGAAIKCNSLPTLPFKIDKLLGDSSGLARMRERARALGHVDAARRVLKAVCT